MLAGDIASPEHSVTIDARGADAMATQGPVSEGAEFVSGFWIIDAPHADAAQHVAVAASRACNRRIELRPLLGLAP